MVALVADQPQPAPALFLMTPQQLQDARNWLGSHWSNFSCPFHGATRWEVGDSMIQTIPFTKPGDLILGGGPTYPLLVVTCGICGFTVLVNAIKAGIVVVPQQPPPSPPAT